MHQLTGKHKNPGELSLKNDHAVKESSA